MTTSTSSRQQKIAEEYIQHISIESVPKSLAEIAAEKLKDPTLQFAISCLHKNKWYQSHDTKNMQFDRDTLQSLEKVKSSLSTDKSGSILIKNNQLVIPRSLQHKCIDLAHEGHLGIMKTKQLIRQKIWFPGVDAMVEDKIKNCISCQSCTQTNTQEPLKMSPCPDSPWLEVSVDFYGPSPKGDYLLVIVDDFSRFPIVAFTSSTSAKSTIPILDKVFSEYGIPATLRSDNGLPFNSHEFSAFAKNLGFTQKNHTFMAQSKWHLRKQIKTFMKKWNLIQTYKFKNQIQLQIATSWNLRSCRSNSHVHHMNRQGNLLYLWNLYVPREFLTQMHHTLRKVAALFANPTNIMTKHDLPRPSEKRVPSRKMVSLGVPSYKSRIQLFMNIFYGSK
ncbi:hypothetical protein RRG08_052334 [Elysia crispata]|uniref:Integrase catalytic domain-containing protein n=1 Tax=Elysia crispata TaxID=231223 RepID=A0AAE1DD39_9GAST|nr:hypothetical protein RRG08_052334 [Elysia crispata]